jgi:NADPH:quinone reductase-like Zn-dependent oxidoreductase
VCSGANADLVRSLGAERVVDHTEVDVTTIGDRFDVVLDAVGVLDIPSGRRLLAPGGVLLLVVAGLADTIRARGDVKAGPSGERAEDFAHLVDLVADGSLTVVVDEVHDLDDVVAAHRRVDTGHKVGNVLIRA